MQTRLKEEKDLVKIGRTSFDNVYRSILDFIRLQGFSSPKKNKIPEQ